MIEIEISIDFDLQDILVLCVKHELCDESVDPAWIEALSDRQVQSRTC